MLPRRISVSLPLRVLNYEPQDDIWLAGDLIHLFNDALSFQPDLVRVFYIDITARWWYRY
jgi:hypothetical protein